MAAGEPTVIRLNWARATWLQTGLILLLWTCWDAFWWLEDEDVPVVPELLLIVALLAGWILLVCLFESLRAMRFGYLLRVDAAGLHIAGGRLLPWTDVTACKVGPDSAWRHVAMRVWFRTREGWKPPWKDSRFGPQLTQDAQDTAFAWTCFLGRADAARLQGELEQWGRRCVPKFQTGWKGPAA